MVEQVIRTTVSKLATFMLSNYPDNPTQDSLEEMLATYVLINENAPVPLSAIKPDYESAVAEFQAGLSQTDGWKDEVITGTGQAVVRLFATDETYSLFSVERAVHETFPETARLPNSIYTGARFLGVRIKRRTPAGCGVTLTRSDDPSNSLYIAPYTKFTLAGTSYFNRDAINFSAGVVELDNVNLYEGEVYTTSFISDATQFQTFVFGNNDFTISDLDVSCYVDGVLWPHPDYTENYSTGLWEYGPTDNIFVESTTTAGNIEAKFGNGITGAIPPLNSTIQFVYVRTNGVYGNSNLVGGTLSCPNYAAISGSITSASINGSNERDPEDYKVLSPGQFSANKGVITPDNAAAAFSNYPGVIDVVVHNQERIAPNDLRYCMVLEVVMITVSVWSTQNWLDFADWAGKRNIANMKLYRRPEQIVSLTIKASVYCFSDTSLNVVENLIRANLATLFRVKQGSLGYSFFLNDIRGAIENSAEAQIDYVTIEAPTQDVVITDWQYVSLAEVDLNMQVSARSKR